MNSKSEASRRKFLGELGELVALKALVDKGFKNISNLNDRVINYPFADLIAEKNGQRFAISVKARNKYLKNGKLNTRYKLSHVHVDEVEKELQAKAHWMAIQFDNPPGSDMNTYSIRFGSVQALEARSGIPMGESVVGEEWEKDRRHYFDFKMLTNQIADDEDGD